MTGRLQAIIFHKDKYTKRTADQWLKRNGYKRIKPLHETRNFLRARLKEPNEDLYKYRMINFKPDIKAVIEYNY